MQIHGLGSAHGPQSVQGPHRSQPSQQAQPAQPRRSAVGVDELDISPEAQLLSQVREVPEIRADRVAEIRAAIESGTYETDEKISLAVDRLFDEIG